MNRRLKELTFKRDILGMYDIYKHCMFAPAEEKFRMKAEAFLTDASVRIFACSEDGATKGVAAISFLNDAKIEIIGIAVAEDARRRGIGSWMIRELTEEYGLISIYAETDGDAVGFYRRNGFRTEKFCECFDGETIVRYRCEWTK